MKFKSKHPQYEFLRKKWISKHKSRSENFFAKHSEKLRHLTLGGVGGLMLLSTPGLTPNLTDTAYNTHEVAIHQDISKVEDKNHALKEALGGVVPSEVRPLQVSEEEEITKILADKLNIKTKAELEGIRLNRSFGMIGGEQHLYRFPGDNVQKHAETASDWAMYGSSGIAPGLGAWGYFSPSESQFSEKDKERERYYIAVPTFLSPGFAENVGRYRDFYKFRKMLLVNPKTGQSVVTVVGDAGPAEWTGKHLGGSPEVMHFLGLAKGPRKGAVLYFFIDDPDDQVPLGPVEVKS